MFHDHHQSSNLTNLPQQAVDPPVFGCIIPSRPVQTNFTHLPPNRFVFQFDDPGSINHLVVFLTGNVPLPDNYAASIHFQFPNKPDWLLLGMLSGTKPSAVFRLKGTMVPSQLDWASSTMGAVPRATATLGILVAPLAEIEAECGALNGAVTLRGPSSGAQSLPGSACGQLPHQLAKAIGLNLFRYLASFSSTTFDNQTWIPIAVLEKWWKQFEFKLANSANPEQWLLDSASAG
ncbi:hypothetical protein PGTUg99_013716 [Puccinia graminis f. sp. tritici]|uniref:Uncharacterized protein n=1 Tax=Puccinia graminis f. sp. tritici TaxID=56615 RepID=A0A5B0PW10_PUCGR|nr:hypothetical protein PGTUg99_013716 [Puccinia graminis f. sp. tritici]